MTQADSELLMLEMLAEEWEGRQAMKRFKVAKARGHGIGVIQYPVAKPLKSAKPIVTPDGEIVAELPDDLQGVELADDEQVKRIMEHVRVHGKLPDKSLLGPPKRGEK